MRLKSVAAVGLVAIALVAAACGSSKKSGTSSSGTNSGGNKPNIVIGTESFTENEVLGYVYADALKAAGYTVTVKPNLGEREVIEPALEKGSINMTIEYLGNYLDYLNPKAGTMSVPDTVSALSKLTGARGLTLATVSNAADSDAIAVTQANATKYNLKTIGDLVPLAPKWTFGGPPECATRITCVPGMKQYYGVVFGSFKSLDEDGNLTHTALQDGTVQAARIFSSDAVIQQDHFVVLEDPKNFQGAGNIIPVMKNSVATPAVLAVLNKVSAALQTSDLVNFNMQVGSNHANPTSVASDYVKSKNLG